VVDELTLGDVTGRDLPGTATPGKHPLEQGLGRAWATASASAASSPTSSSALRADLRLPGDAPVPGRLVGAGAVSAAMPREMPYEGSLSPNPSIQQRPADPLAKIGDNAAARPHQGSDLGCDAIPKPAQCLLLGRGIRVPQSGRSI
jgi:hypothetical protein